MNYGGWNVDAGVQVAAEFRVLARRYPKITVRTAEVVDICEKSVAVMRDANAAADEITALKAKVVELETQLAERSPPKFAPFAPRARR